MDPLPRTGSSPPIAPDRAALAGARAPVLAAALAYFGLVFGTGFVLGTVRVLWLVPRLGVRTAELLEMPLMAVAIVLGARFVVRRFALPAHGSARLVTGLLALALLVGAELGLTLALQPVSLAEYIKGRDPVSGTVYLILLAVFGAMPWVLARVARRRP